MLSGSTRPVQEFDHSRMDLLHIVQLKRAAAEGRTEARVHAQIESLTRKDTREGKPFYAVVLADAGAKLTLRAWSDGPAFEFCEGAKAGDFVEVSGEFGMSPGFGLDSKRWSIRELRPDELAELLEGPPEVRGKQADDYAFLEKTVRLLADPRLAALCGLFLDDFGDRFRRAAAARANHHARRGGLVEHVAQMMRAALAISAVYPALNRDLLAAGVLFHDCGKLWENQMPVDGFMMPFDERGELLGHITIGIEVVNTLWRRLQQGPHWAEWLPLEPASEDVRLHLLHLLASHHGEMQFGSPVVPKTPEAWALHYVDNLDAKIEMMHGGYAASKHLAPRIQEKVWPLPGNLVTPLGHFPQPPTVDGAS